MIQTDCKTQKCIIRGTAEDITDEASVLLANICHDVIMPMGENPAEYLAGICVRVLEIIGHEELFKHGKSVRMVIPIKGGEDEQQEQ